MQQVMFMAGQWCNARYEFVCRNTPNFPLSKLSVVVNDELDHLCTLRYTQEELQYIASLPNIRVNFIEYLKCFKFDRKYITVYAEGDDLRIVAEGPQIEVMNFEIFCLAIVSELYFEHYDKENLLHTSRLKLTTKINRFKIYEDLQIEFTQCLPQARRLNIFDFGTRRRWSKKWHDEMVNQLSSAVPNTFSGTSNIYLAMKYGLKLIGTMGHEYLQSYQTANVNLRAFQWEALDNWLRVFSGENSIALTDTIGIDAFLKDFDFNLASQYAGVRHDSGCPYTWVDKIINHYKSLGIDPLTKYLIFSDGLTVIKAVELHEYVKDKSLSGFGIGTHLSNDTGKTPLNIVMKLVSINGNPVAKISDSPGKTICHDQLFVDYLKHIFEK